MSKKTISNFVMDLVKHQGTSLRGTSLLNDTFKFAAGIFPKKKKKSAYAVQCFQTKNGQICKYLSQKVEEVLPYYTGFQTTLIRHGIYFLTDLHVTCLTCMIASGDFESRSVRDL